jgi:beta-glucosidase
LTTNTNHALPYNISDPEDIAACNRQLAFAFGWYIDPLVFGKYPDKMTSVITNGKLPSFTEEESAMLKGSYDFIGLNHYTSNYAMNDPTSSSDQKTRGTVVDIDGKLIGPQAESGWLFVYPPGMRGLLNWIDSRYNHAKIYIFENGVSVPHENDMPISEAIHDTFRVNYYKGYIKNAIDAMTIDGVNLGGYFGWSLMDNFEWADGYSTRFGMTYVDYNDN